MRVRRNNVRFAKSGSVVFDGLDPEQFGLLHEPDGLVSGFETEGPDALACVATETAPTACACVRARC